MVGLAPLKSLEQLGPMGIFFWLQLLMIIHRLFRASSLLGYEVPWKRKRERERERERESERE